jgi:hypothetical protein
MSIWKYIPFVIAVPVLHRVFVCPSRARAGTSVVLLFEAVATHPVRGNGDDNALATVVTSESARP